MSTEGARQREEINVKVLQDADDASLLVALEIAERVRERASKGANSVCRISQPIIMSCFGCSCRATSHYAACCRILIRGRWCFRFAL
jgi:hypothetical protein